LRLLAIETSCDDTSAAVVDDDAVLSNVVSSQDDIHADFGGIVPELAARRHLESIGAVVTRAMERARVDYADLDGLAVTRGPGLVGSLLVGLSAAQGLALRTKLPLFGVNHLEGHVLSVTLDREVEMPFLALLVSGGHTALYLVRAIGDYGEVASTRDDSAGEAFDKAAKMLDLGYPGGKVIDELARSGDAGTWRFPRGRVKDDPLALSFSGLKTSLWEFLRTREESIRIEDICASFQEAIVDVLIDRAERAMHLLRVPRLAIVGGVSANSRLRLRAAEVLEAAGGELIVPPFSLCTDNAAMIARTAILRLSHGLDGDELTASSRLPLGPRLQLQ
jgi:N6-L-threonylcarbamoyladenine synthase